MSLQMTLMTLQGNDTAFYLDVAFNGEPLNLTGYTPKVIQKSSQTASDASGTTYTVGAGLTVLNASLGRLKLVIPHSAVTTAGTQWWRLDITDTNGANYTVFYGPLVIKAV